eukprot:GFUD01085404.1.p1 GENE.GFUD01085404.1~~GFUD01085404.1.p1  ORF type:complete len:276 (+),score=109.67 GFUD01085404.1:102-929(+)
MELSSKLGRQMAYKKKLEEEQRLAEERRMAGTKSKYPGYQVRLLETGECGREGYRRQNNYNRGALHAEEDKERELDILKQKQREEEYQKEKAKLLKKREEYMERAATFSELKKERINEKNIDKSKQKIFVEEEEMWAELEKVIKENEIALKDLEDYRIFVEVNENKEKMKLKLEEELRIGTQENCKEGITDIEEEKLSQTEQRIRELELSITSLDYELDRLEIEKMNCKTRQVKKRMSQVTGDSAKELQNMLKPGTVEAFIKDGNMWRKYLTGAK